MATRSSRGLCLAVLTEFVSQFNDCVLQLFTGSPPASANDVEPGTLLVTITQDSLAFVGGSPTNGLSFDIATAQHFASYSQVGKTVAESWSGVGLATGVAGWGRLYANAFTTGASTTAVRLDGLCGLSNAQFIMSNLNITLGETTTVSACNVIFPAY